MEILIEEEIEIDQDYTQGLINNVIEGISDVDSMAQTRKGRKGKNKRGKFKPKKDIPDFEL